MGFENYYKLIEAFVDADNSAIKNTKGTKVTKR
jgi:hypothetical protein